jgi:hypothetical protein
MGQMPSLHHGCNGGFVSQFHDLFGPILDEFVSLQDPGRGPEPKLAAWQLLASLVYHVLDGAGALSAHVYQLFKVEIKDSSLSERRQRIGLEPFAWLMQHALKPMADGRSQKSCFYKKMRLCGIDGSSWSVTNTPQILEKMGKAASRRLKAAFAKLEMCVLVELGLHNPIAATVGLKGEGEWSLGAKLLESIPKGSLLIVDRLYGCGKYLKELVKGCEVADSELLVRARSSNKSHKIQRLSDGSAVVSIKLRKQRGAVREEVRVREIRGRIRKPGGRKWSEVRLWTTLLDEKEYPAQELLELYGMRWEQEIFYKELKLHMRGSDVLQSHTPETAAQEVAALLMACSIIAEQRAEAGRSGQLQALSISFVKTLHKISSLWAVFEVSDGLLDEATRQEMLKRVRELIVREAIPPRRKRSCPRKVRQPVCSWPRLTKNESDEGEFTFEIINFP